MLFTSKRLISSLLIPFFLFSLSLFALPTGNPAAPLIIKEGFLSSPANWSSVRGGYEGSFVFDRRLDQKPGGVVDNFTYDQNSFIGSLNIQNRLDLFGTIGQTRYRSDWRVYTEKTVSKIDMESRYHHHWSLGGKGVLVEWSDTYLTVAGRYLTGDASLSWLTKDGRAQDVKGASIDYSEWQIDMSLAHKVDFFIPYIGAVFAKSYVDIGTMPSTVISSDGKKSLHMESRKKVGMVVGSGLTNGKYFYLNIEGRIFYEEAISITGELKF